MLWNTGDLKVNLDINTYCNAGCPQCHRTNPNGLGKADWLPLVQWNLETFKKAFPEDQLLYDVSQFAFVGTWGDTLMTKDLFEIVEYIINSNHLTTITIETNGSLRDEEWWWDFGIMAGKRLTVRFDVDGIDQEMHAKYRRKTNLQKVLNNMNMLSQTQANVASQTIVFKHNQDYLDEIRQLCIDNGSAYHTNVISDRFENYIFLNWKVDENGNFTFINEDGEKEILEKASRDSLKNDPFVSGTKKTTLDDRITCRWALPRNEIIIKPDGNVLPCCYHANSYYIHMNTGKDNTLSKSKYFQEYLKNKNEYNIFNDSLYNILKKEWFAKTLPESFKSDDPIDTCVRQCSNRIKKEHQLRENIFVENVTR